MKRFYPIGTPGQPWSEQERTEWFSRQTRRRSYAGEVLTSLRRLPSNMHVHQYGALPIDRERYRFMQ